MMPCSEGEAASATAGGPPRPAGDSSGAAAALGRIWRWVRPLIGLGLLGFLLWQVDWQEMAAVLSQALGGYILLALLIEMLGVLPRVLRWRALLAVQGSQVSFPRLVSIYLVGSFFTNFLPSDVGGDSMRMLRLAKLTGQSANAVSSVLIERLCGLFAVLLVGVVAVLGNWPMAVAGGIGYLVLGVFAGFVVAMVLLFGVRWSWDWTHRLSAPWMAAIAGKLRQLYGSAHAFRSYPGTLLVVVGFSLLYRLGGIWGLYVQALALGVDVTFVWLMMAVSMIAVVTALPLSLNGLGIKEGAYVFFFGLAGIAAPQALALALLSRGLTLVVSLIGGAIYLTGR